MCNITQNKSCTTVNCPPCVRCGYCCIKGVCCYGNQKDILMVHIGPYNGCYFLKQDDPVIGTFICTKREEIMGKEIDSPYPMFDNYCSSPLFNNMRDEVIRKMKGRKKMGTTRTMIREWLERGQKEGATHVIIVCDTFSYEDYPIMVKPGEKIKEKIAKYNNDKNMQEIIEIYDLSMDIEEQIEAERVYNC